MSDLMENIKGETSEFIKRINKLQALGKTWKDHPLKGGCTLPDDVSDEADELICVAEGMKEDLDSAIAWLADVRDKADDFNKILIQLDEMELDFESFTHVVMHGPTEIE